MLRHRVTPRRVEFHAPGRSCSFIRRVVEDPDEAARLPACVAYTLGVEEAAARYLVRRARAELNRAGAV